MKIMIDTSVWIECGKDADLRLAIEKIGENNEIRSSEIIDEEIERAYDLLIRQKRHGESKFWELYFKLKKATVKESETVKSLTNEYYKEGQKIKLKVGQMIADLTIVASASLDNADFILTLNRKTMSSDLARNVYSLVNSRRKLKTLQFLTDKLSIRNGLLMPLSLFQPVIMAFFHHLASYLAYQFYGVYLLFHSTTNRLLSILVFNFFQHPSKLLGVI